MVIEQSYIIILNIIMIILFLWTIFKGYKDGLIATLFSLLASIALYFLAWPISKILGSVCILYKYEKIQGTSKLVNEFITKNINQIIWYVLIIVVGTIMIKLIFNATKAINKIKIVGNFNQIGGIILGFIITLLYASVMGFVLNLGLFSNGAEVINKTILYAYNYPVQIGSNIAHDFIKNEGTHIVELLGKETTISETDLEKIINLLKEKGVSEDEIKSLLPIQR